MTILICLLALATVFGSGLYTLRTLDALTMEPFTAGRAAPLALNPLHA